ncbi:hypothetical protein SAMIE_1006830 [Sphingobium amiense]|uniref:DUF2285 domain-containing protein n=1 Tax=Sphingobium amiense TaxID=135719 RepID=A0A494W9U6_9SPHN|nr:DUF2285 domain-containing protein [Sphingobium amiense]BBD97182.1 hypothetical protein SAMIE_1006830 [Sphingobium amiense]
MRRCSNASRTAPSQRTPPRRRSRGAGGYPFATAPDDLSDPVIWRPELTAVTVILDAAPEGFETAAPVDPRALGALLADEAGIDGRHVIVADAAGEHRLWLRDPQPDQPLAAIIPLDKDFITRVVSMLRFHRRLLGRAAGPLPRGWPLTAYRLARLDLMLRALDLRHRGATYRQIAAELGRADAIKLSASDWKMSASRSFVVRLVRDGLAMMNGDYRKLLRIR